MKTLKQQPISELIQPICQRCQGECGHLPLKEIIDKLLKTKVSTDKEIREWLEQKRQQNETRTLNDFSKKLIRHEYTLLLET